MVAYEGDYSTSGDTATLNSTQLGTALSPGSNFFNGTNDNRGTSVTARDPADLNNLGFDIKNVGASGVIPNSATSATLSLTSTGDRYFPGVVTSAINLYAPDFSPSTKSVSDLAGNDPAQPGDTLRYTVNFANRGGDPAADSVMSDPLPEGVTYVPGSLRIVSGANPGAKTDAADSDQAEYDAAARSVHFRLGPGANGTAGGLLAPGAGSTVTFDVTIDDDAGGSTITNSASLSYVAQTVGTPFTYDVKPVPVRVAALANLQLTKELSPDPTLAGQPATATIRVHNAGPSAARDVVISDPTPDGVTLGAASSSVGTCSTAGGDVSCALGTLANRADATVTVTLQVPAGSTTNSLADLATVSSSTEDPDEGDNSAGAAVSVQAAADLSVTKTATPTTVTPGGLVTYTVTVHNSGPSDARNAVLDDEADPDTMMLRTADPAPVCGDPDPGFTAVQCQLGTVAAGATRVFTFTGLLAPDVTAGTPSVNHVTVSSDTSDADDANNTAAATVTAAAPRSVLHVDKSADPSTVVAGHQVTYTISVDNDAGPSDAPNVVVRDPMPTGFTATSASTSRGSCTVGDTVVCSIGTLVAGMNGSAGGSATITITADVASSVTAGSVDNTATASGTSADAVTATAPVTVVTRADLDVHKSASASPTATGQPIVAGGEAYFTIVATNHGPSVARDVEITDQLAAEFTFVSATAGVGSCAAPTAGGLLTCAVGDLADQGTATVVVHVHVPSNYDGSAEPDTARVSSSTTDPDQPDNDAVYTVSGATVADLALTKTAAPDPVVAGGRVTYTLTATNFGPSDAGTVVVSDELPAGLTFTDAIPDECTTTGQRVSCTGGTLAAGGTAKFEIEAAVAPSLESGATITNNASVTSAVEDPAPDNNSANVSSEIRASADLSITKAEAIAAGPPGALTQFELRVVNNGPSVARDVTVVDHFDVDASAAVRPDGVCDILEGDLQCALGDLAPGATTVIEIQNVVVSNADPGAYVNRANVASATPDADTSNNTASVTFTVTDPVAVLRLSKTADPSTFVAGSTFSYALTLTSGALGAPGRTEFGSDAQDVVVTDTLPTGLIPTAAATTQGACDIAVQTITCHLGTVHGPISQSQVGDVTMTVTGDVAPNAPAGAVTNTATVTTATTLDPDSAPTATVSTPVERQAALELSKTADADPLVAGSLVSYTLTATNTGPSDADAVVVADPLPAGLTFDPDASDAICAPAGGAIRCDLGTIAAGDSQSFVVAGQLSPSFDGARLVNTATATSPTAPDPATAADDTTVTRAATLRLEKTADSLTPSVGTEFEYNLTRHQHRAVDRDRCNGVRHAARLVHGRQHHRNGRHLHQLRRTSEADLRSRHARRRCLRRRHGASPGARRQPARPGDQRGDGRRRRQRAGGVGRHGQCRGRRRHQRDQDPAHRPGGRRPTGHVPDHGRQRRPGHRAGRRAQRRAAGRHPTAELDHDRRRGMHHGQRGDHGARRVHARRPRGRCAGLGHRHPRDRRLDARDPVQHRARRLRRARRRDPGQHRHGARHARRPAVQPAAVAARRRRARRRRHRHRHHRRSAPPSTSVPPTAGSSPDRDQPAGHLRQRRPGRRERRRRLVGRHRRERRRRARGRIARHRRGSRCRLGGGAAARHPSRLTNPQPARALWHDGAG